MGMVRFEFWLSAGAYSPARLQRRGIPVTSGAKVQPVVVAMEDGLAPVAMFEVVIELAGTASDKAPELMLILKAETVLELSLAV